jgi:ribosome biogenesis GTPase
MENEGVVIREHRGAFEVETDQGTVLCTLRSRLRKNLVYPESENRRRSVEAIQAIEATSPVAIGDRVRIVRFPDGTGAIEETLPRRSWLSRSAPGRRMVEQVIAANLDQLLIVFAVRRPEPHLRLLDRLLVAAEMGNITPVICLNKMDLWTPDLPDIHSIYTDAGYMVINASAHTGQGVDELRALLTHRFSAIAGPSGVGKTSLLNRIQPDLGLRIKEVSETTGRGRHTTSYLAAHRLDGGGMVIDTPGVREFALWRCPSESLPEMFPEMRPWMNACRFTNCAHVHEPDCRIKEKVDDGTINRERYESYVALRDEPG